MHYLSAFDWPRFSSFCNCLCISNYFSDSPIYTPQDGDMWMLAKLNVQLTDLGCSQMVEHLTKVHFVVEPLCLSYERQISNKHPFYEILRYHCLGIFTTNTLAAPELLDERKALHEIFGYGHEGAAELLRQTAQILQWEDLKPSNNIKARIPCKLWSYYL